MTEQQEYEQMLDYDLRKEQFLKSSYNIKADDVVRTIEAFAGDKNKSDEKRPGFFSRHVLFGDLNNSERLALIYMMEANEIFRHIYRAAVTPNAAKMVVESNEIVASYGPFTSRARDGKERQYLSKSVTEVISTRPTEEKKKGLRGMIPFKGGK